MWTFEVKVERNPEYSVQDGIFHPDISNNIINHKHTILIFRRYSVSTVLVLGKT